MAPARKKPKAHQKCKIVRSGTKFIDNYKREFVVGKEIGQGGFGRIYEATQGVPKRLFAVKMEPMGNGPLFTEMHVYMKVLKEEVLAKWKKENGLKFLGLPSLISSGKFTYEEEEMRYIVLPRYNDSVEQAIERNEGKLTYKDVVDMLNQFLMRSHICILRNMCMRT
uniref:Protein kinase domain-containing protein n=1 Tax=Ditylenchus dipsaci TaxID=166011 RepID=A0A915EMK3_9BILA